MTRQGQASRGKARARRRIRLNSTASFEVDNSPLSKETSSLTPHHNTLTTTHTTTHRQRRHTYTPDKIIESSKMSFGKLYSYPVRPVFQSTPPPLRAPADDSLISQSISQNTLLTSSPG
jgi:hypothetical protein